MVDNERFMRAMRKIYERSGGKAFEQHCANDHPLIKWGVEQGYWRIVDGRCGFEMIPDCMLAWTGAAHEALRTPCPVGTTET